jgi:outer membrane protein assembly factor BamB
MPGITADREDQKLNIKNQNCGIPASRDDFLNFAFCTLIFAFSMSVSSVAAAQSTEAGRILQTAGVKGGLIVHLGCGDGKLTAALRVGDSYLVHGLDTDPQAVRRAREYIGGLGVYGPVSVDQFDGKLLPYSDDLVNLIISERIGNVSAAEIMRVLTPDGVAYIKNNGAWTKTVKSWPASIDEWTHFLHGSDNNAVSEDTEVAPPHHLRWVAGPRWARSHDHLASLSAAVSANGRLFYIIDEGPVASVEAPARWMLVARDAFNGVPLWKREISPWEDQLRPFRSGPTELPRRLVASGNRVYVTPGYGKPVTTLDAATGETIRTFSGTDNTQEILFRDNKLFLVVSEAPAEKGASADLVRRLSPWSGREVYNQYVVKYPARSIRVIDAATGELVWQKKDAETELLLPTTLAVSDGRVFYQNQQALIALEADSGDLSWRSERPVSLHRPSFSSPTLVVHDGVVLSADRSHKATSKTGGADKTKMEWLVGPMMTSTEGQLMAFSAQTGEKLWSAPCYEAFNSPVDVFVAQGKVWTGATRSARQPGITNVYDLHTGEVTETRSRDQEHFTVGFVHGRCYRNKATVNYVIHGRAGVEFVDMSTDKVTADHWIRGTCQYGILPANGLLYVPPHSCPCYNEAKLNSFNALAATIDERRWTRDATPRRLEKGPAYNQIANRKSKIENPFDWPTYRRDGTRSGATETSLSLPLQCAWEKALPGPLRQTAGRTEGRPHLACAGRERRLASLAIYRGRTYRFAPYH